MSNTTLKYEVPLFDGKSNFTLWQSTIQDYLVQQGLDIALEDEKPSCMKDGDWSMIQRKAVSTIRLALAPQIKMTVLKETSPNVLWKKLESTYLSKSLTNRLCLKMDLYTLRMDEGRNIYDHINNFNQLVCQLLNLGEKIEEEEQSLLLLASLPKSFKPLVQTLLVGKNTLQLNDVIMVLKENDRMMGEDGGGPQILIAAGSDERGRNHRKGDRSGRSRSRPRDMSTVECYYCGETGHMQSRCPQFKQDLKSLQGMMKGKQKVGDPSINVVEDYSDVLVTAANDLVEDHSSWVLDSAADMHICRDRACFDTLQEEEEFDYIHTASKQKLKIEGVGRVRLKLHNGVVKTLADVKFVPTAKTNIISLGELASRGYKYVGDEDFCKVFRGDILVLQGRKKGKNIYYLEGCSLNIESSRTKKTKTPKRVQFSDTVEICEDLGRGRICWENSPNPTLFKSDFGELVSPTLLKCKSGKGTPPYK